MKNIEKHLIGEIRAFCDACTNGTSGTCDDSPSILSALVNTVDSAHLFQSGTQAERAEKIARFLTGHRNDIPARFYRIGLKKPALKKTPAQIAQIFADCLNTEKHGFTVYEINTDCFQLDSLNNHFLNAELFADGEADEIGLSTRYDHDAVSFFHFVNYMTTRFSNLFELRSA